MWKNIVEPDRPLIISYINPTGCTILFNIIYEIKQGCTVNKTQKTADGNMAHAHCMMDTQGYKYTLRLCTTYCSYTVITVARMHFSATLYVHCLSCLMLNLVVRIITTRFYKDNDLNTRFIDLKIYGSSCPCWSINSDTNIPAAQISVGDRVPEIIRRSQQNVGTVLSYTAQKAAFKI